jgi:hypothetical protein
MKTFPRMMAIALAAFLTISAVSAQAAPIQGSIDFGGVVTFDTTSLLTATRVNLWNSSFVLQDSGDFATFVSAGAPATMATPWIFKPSTTTPSLWSVGGFKFDLLNSVVVSQTANFLNVTGTGTISGNGFMPTAGTWSFTSSSSNGSGQATFGFQAQSTAVPEPAASALVAIGACALIARACFVAKRNRANVR